MNPEQRVAAIDEAVKLTAEQKPKVTAILTKASADVQALSQEERDARRSAAARRMTSLSSRAGGDPAFLSSSCLLFAPLRES